MAKFVSRKSKQGFLSVFADQFSSLDPLTKMFIVTIALIIGATPYIVGNYQTFLQNAAGNGKGGRDTLSLASNSNPVFKGQVYFQVAGSNVTTSGGYLYVYNACSQNGTLVYAEYGQVAATGLTSAFTLGPTSLWTSGGAQCTAIPELINSNKGSFKASGPAITYTVSP